MRILDTSQQIAVSGYIAPIISGVICILVVLIFLIKNNQKDERVPTLLLLAELVACVFSWVGMIAYVVDPNVFISIKAPFLLSITWVHVLTYHFVFVLTKIGNHERFSPIHYILPLIIVSVIFVWAQFVPYPVKFGLIQASDIIPQGYEIFAFFYNSARYLFPIYGILYSVLGFRRITRFGQALQDYSADEGNSSITWLRVLVFVTLMTVPLSAVPVLTGTSKLVGSIILLIPALLIILKDVLLTYNTVVKHYVLIDISEEENSIDDIPTNAGLEKNSIELYMLSEKPFIDPKIRIVILAQILCTNRTYLSNFINKEYGMNFSRFINRYRLNELSELRKNRAYRHMSNMELVQKAGFSTFGGYLRAKKQEERINTLSDKD